MTLRALVTHWSTDGTIGLAFVMATAVAGALYAYGAAAGARKDPRNRRWPCIRTACFLGGLVVLVLDVDSGIGVMADSWLSAHMIEHMVMMQIVAPLLAAGAPIRLALFNGSRSSRQRIARWIHSPMIKAMTSATGSMALFAGVLVVSHVPVVYDLTLRSDSIHIAEHAAFVCVAVVMWAPLLRADPMPQRTRRTDRVICVVGCVLPMAGLGLWLAAAHHVIYGQYASISGPAAALHDQRLAALIMLLSCVPMLATVAMPRLGPPRLVSRREVTG